MWKTLESKIYGEWSYREMSNDYRFHEFMQEKMVLTDISDIFFRGRAEKKYRYGLGLLFSDFFFGHFVGS